MQANLLMPRSVPELGTVSYCFIEVQNQQTGANFRNGYIMGCVQIHFGGLLKKGSQTIKTHYTEECSRMDFPATCYVGIDCMQRGAPAGRKYQPAFAGL